MRPIVCLFLIIFLTTSAGLSGSEGISFKGLVQTWFSYADQDAGNDSGYGFTLRRVRFKPYGSLSKTVKWTLQAAWDKQSVSLMDAYLDFDFSRTFKIRAGQFTVPGTISSSLTSSAKLDLIERPMITQRWGGINGLKSYRGLGVQVHGDLFKGKLYYALMMANPTGVEFFNPSVKASEYINEHNMLLLVGRLEVKLLDGLRLGAFLGGGTEQNTQYVRNSYGAHLFYVKNAVNFKVEYIAGQFGAEGQETRYGGMYAVLGYKIGKIEPIVRFDFYTPNDGASDGYGVKRYDNFTLGLNYFHSKNVKFQVNYVTRAEEMNAGLNSIKNNLFYICCQYTY